MPKGRAQKRIVKKTKPTNHWLSLVFLVAFSFPTAIFGLLNKIETNNLSALAEQTSQISAGLNTSIRDFGQRFHWSPVVLGVSIKSAPANSKATIKIAPVIKTSAKTTVPTITNLLERLKNLEVKFANQKTQTIIIKGERGEKGDKGDKGDSGSSSAGSLPAIQYIYANTIATPTADPHNVTSLSAMNISAETFVGQKQNITDWLTVGGAVNFRSTLNVAGAVSLSGDLDVAGAASFGSLTLSTLNATTTNFDTLTINNNATTTGAHYIGGDLTVGGYLYGDGSRLTGISAGSGSGASNWQAPWANTLTPTSSTAGIFVNASSTINSNFRVQSDLAEIPKFVVGSSTATSLYVASNGYVGVGTNSPSEKLEVNGNLKVSNIGFLDTTPVSSYGIYADKSYTDPVNDTDIIAIMARPTYTGAESASESFYAISNDLLPIVNTGHNNTGSQWGYAATVYRNINGASADDSGTLNGIGGLSIGYGHYNSNAAATPQTTNAYGIRINPMYRTGTITNMYDIYLNSATTGGTATNRWGIYQANSAHNYFAGNLGLGTTTPYAALSVVNDSYTAPKFMVASSTGFSTPSLYVASNGNVGVGTNAPSQVLDVNGNLQLLYNLYFGSTQTSINASAEGLKYTVYNAASRGQHFITGGLERLTIGYDGNIGIATTTPYAKLSVVSDTAEIPKFMVASSTSFTTPSLYVASNGNVGVGTGSPSYLLHIEGATIANENSGVVYIKNTGGSTGNYISLKVDGYSNLGGFRINAGDAANSLYKTSAGNIGFTSYNTASDITFAGGSANYLMTIKGTGNVGIATTTPYAKLSIVSDDYNLPKFMVASSTGFSTPSLYVASNGRVGVGTNNPQVGLHVYTTNYAPQMILERGSAGGAAMTLTNTQRSWTFGLSGTNAGIFSINTGTAIDSNAKFAINTSGNVGIATTTPYAKLSVVSDTAELPKFMVASSTSFTTPSLYVASDGNVGIGTNNPTDKLTIAAGHVKVDSNYGLISSSLNAVRFVPYDSSTNMGLTAYNDIWFKTYSGGTYNEKARITQSGNLGIATTTPYAKLSVVSDDYDLPKFMVASSTGFTTPSLYVASNGNVGVGTNNPGTLKLYVNGNTHVNGQLVTNILTGGSGSDLRFGVYSGTEQMRLTTAGNVGIGTTTPYSALTVVNDSYTAPKFMVASSTGFTTPSLYVASNGYVGVGTNAPTHTFTVNGFSKFVDTANFTGQVNIGGLLEVNNIVTYNSNTNLTLNSYTNGYNVVMATNGGNVGIANTNPQYKLDVAGDININAASSIYMNGLRVLNASSTTYSLSMGTSAGNSLNDGGLYNVFAGYQAGYNATSSDYNTGIGYSALYSVVNSDGNGGKYNTAIGSEALYANTTGYQNLGLGYYALHDNTTGASNFGLGFKALRYNTVGSSNVAIGNNSLYSNQTAGFNTAVGHSTLYNNVSGASNVALGYNALYKNITGTGNIAIGHNAGYYNNSATSSVIIGHNAAWGNANYSNKELTVIGYQAGYNMDTGSDANTFLGYQTGYTLTTASNNTLIGYKAGYAINSGANNILLGYKAGDALTTGTKNIVIGYDIDAPAVDSTNILNIGNILFGTGLTGSGTNIAGSIGIATSTPGGTYGEKLTVVGDTYIQGNATTTHLAVTEMCLNGDCQSSWPTGTPGTTGTPGAWESIWTNTLAPTSSVAGIFVTGSSTINADFRISGNATTTGNYDIGGQIALNGAVNASNKIINTTGGNATDNYVYSVYNNLRSGKSAQALYGAYNVLTSDNISVNMYGTYNTGSMTGNNGGQVLYGNYTTLTASATGAQVYGSYASLTSNQSASQTLYGNYVTLQTDSSGAFMDSAYGYYVIDTGTASTGGTQYGLYVDVDDANVTNYSLYINEGSGISYFGSAIGIATTTPGGYYGEKLAVVGNMYIQGNATSTGAQYLDGDLTVGGRYVSLFKNGTTPLKLRNNGSDSNIIENGASGGYLALGADPSTYSLVIDYNERVGIGTAGNAIDAKLEIMGSTNPQLLINNNDDTQWGFYSGYQSIGGNLTITRSGANGNFILANAGLGVANSNPQFKLDVAGDVNINATSSLYMNSLKVLNASSTTYSVSVGTQAGNNLNDAGRYNAFLGYQAGYLATSTDYNTGIGYQSLYNNMADGLSNNGQYNTALGALSLYSATGGRDNTAVGYSALAYNTGSYSSYNTAVGSFAMGAVNPSITSENTAVGYKALSVVNGGNQNTAVGLEALKANSSGAENSAFGVYAMNTNTTGSYNVAIGKNALYYGVTSTNMVALGHSAANGNNNFTSKEGVYLGSKAGNGLGNGANGNVMIGYKSGYLNTTGANNIFIGYQSADAVTTGSNNIIIGYDIDAPSAAGSNQLNIGNLIFGAGIDGTGTNISSGSIGIATSTPGGYFSEKLTVAGGAMVTGTTTIGTSNTLVVNANENRVGVGTATPGYPLHVQSASFPGGIISLFKTSGNADTAFQVQNSVAAWQFSVRESGDANPGGFNFYYSPDGSTGWVNAMNLTTVGDVSIPTGKLGVSNSSPSTILHVGSGTTGDGNQVTIQDNNGTCTLNPGSGASWSCTSDQNLKHDINPLETGLSAIMALKPSTFKMNADNSSGVGFVAQEVREVLPRLVTHLHDGTLAVSEGGMMPYVVKAIQEQQTTLSQVMDELGLASTWSAIQKTNEIPATPIENIVVLNHTLTINYDLIIKGHSYFSADSIGQAKILAGTTTVSITFDQAYGALPIVTISAYGEEILAHNIRYSVTNASSTGFMIKISESLDQDLTFNWHAFASPEAKLFISDGTNQDLQLSINNEQLTIDNPIVIDQPIGSFESAPTDEDNLDAGVVAGESTTTEEITVEEATPEEVVTDEPLADEIDSEEPVVEEPAVIEPTIEEPVVGEPVAEDPIAEEPAVETPIEESTAETPAEVLTE